MKFNKKIMSIALLFASLVITSSMVFARTSLSDIQNQVSDLQNGNSPMIPLVGDTNAICDASASGLLRFNGVDFEGCNGMEWIVLNGNTIKPAFQVKNPISNNFVQSVVVFSDEVFDDGNNYNPSTGKFIAPIAGKYVFSYKIVFGNASTDSRYRSANLTVNGVNANGIYDALSVFTNQSNNSFITLSDTIILNLDIGDSVAVKLGGYSAPWDGDLYQPASHFNGYFLQQ